MMTKEQERLFQRHIENVELLANAQRQKNKKAAVRNIAPSITDQFISNMQFLAGQMDVNQDNSALAGGSDDVLPTFTINWEEEAARGQRKTSGKMAVNKNTETIENRSTDEEDNVLPEFAINWEAEAARQD